MKKMVTAVVSFSLVFLSVFLLSGWFISPHLPAMPDVPATVRRPEFWTANWAGVALGLLLGLLSAKSVMRPKKRAR